MRSLHCLLFICALVTPQPAPCDEWVLGMEELHRLDRLPAYRSSKHVATISSYDRSGGNDDGFSGTYSFVRKEPEGLVIADLEGPGIIYRIWTPTPTEDIVEFFFDGEESPRIRTGFRDLFLGKQAPFLAPLCGYGAGGFYSYVPLGFRKSCRIRVRSERVQFYQIHYAIYPEEAPVETYDPEPSASYRGHREKARKLFAAAGSDISPFTVPQGADLERSRKAVEIAAGKTVTLFETSKAGRIAGLRISPASALAGKDRGLVLRIAFDGEEKPSVLCPAGDFFGYAWGQPAMQSLLLGTHDDVSYCHFPMPFDRSARIEIVSERGSGPPVRLEAEVAWAAVPRSPQEGTFRAIWRRENPTRKGTPFTFIDTEGRGHLAGFVLQSQGFESGKTLFFEGDDQTTLDGELTIHGTGSEDFFNGGWYDVPDRWEKRISFPLSGCLGYQKHLGRTGGYRILVGDVFPFRESVLQTIEHGGTGNSIPTDYSAVTYLYSADPPEGAGALPPPPERGVVDLKEVIFPAWWQIPIRAFPFHKATLTREAEKLDGEEVRFLSLEATGTDWFGPPFLFVVCDVPAAGRYSVSVEVVKGPAEGKVQLFRNEVPVGEAVDLYAESREKSERLKLGTLELREGENSIMLKLPGKNSKSEGVGLDLIHVICKKES